MNLNYFPCTTLNCIGELERSSHIVKIFRDIFNLFYEIHLHYVWLPSSLLCNERIIKTWGNFHYNLLSSSFKLFVVSLCANYEWTSFPFLSWRMSRLSREYQVMFARKIFAWDLRQGNLHHERRILTLSLSFVVKRE